MREVVRSYYYQANERLPQYNMEAVLRRKLATLPTVETNFGWSAETVEQDSDSARVSIFEEQGGGRRVLEADYVVGCDGAKSITRDSVNFCATFVPPPTGQQRPIRSPARRERYIYI